MSLWRRILNFFRIKANKAMDAAEDPREMIDDAYNRQVELLQRTRQSIADVVTSRKRLEIQAQKLQAGAVKLEAQARQALGQDKEELAREALRRRAAIGEQLANLKVEHEQLKAEEERLKQSSQTLQQQVETFRTRKEAMKASYTSAEARTKVSEAISGVGGDLAEIGQAIQRAEDRTAELQARAGALDELIESGALTDATQGADTIQMELDKISVDSDIERELLRLRGGQQPAALPPTAEGDLFALPAAPAPQTDAGTSTAT